MMTTLGWILSAAIWMQDPAPKDPPPPPPPPPRVERQDPGRPERRDPFEGPRVPNPPRPPDVDDVEHPRDVFERQVQRSVMLIPEAELKAWVTENEPDTLRRWNQFTKEDRLQEANRLLTEANSRMREFKELKERDPKGFEKMIEMRRLERDSMEQAEQARRAPPEEREAASKKLKETLSRLFDAREEIRVRELGELKRRVEALEKAMAERKTNKDRIVEKRRRELMGEKSEDDW